MIKIHKNSIELCDVFPSSTEGYYINRSSLKTESQLNKWLSHLEEKNWFSIDLKKELISTFYKLKDM